MELTFEPTSVDDFEILVELRIDAMRESLETIGRFNRERSVERFRSSFSPENTKIIRRGKDLAGFITVSEKEDHFYLDHLYIDPKLQSLGIGSKVLKGLIETSEKKGLPVRLGALRSSKSNDFYKRHGFVVSSEDEFDIYYERKPQERQVSAYNSRCGATDVVRLWHLLAKMTKPNDSGSLSFRALSASDAQVLFEEVFSDEQATRYLQWNVHESSEETKKLVTEMVEEHRKGEKFFWIGIDANRNRAIGLGSVKPDGYAAWIGIIIFKKEQRKGYGKKMITALDDSVSHCFDFSLAEVNIGNVGSSALFESAGWHEDFSAEQPDSKIYRRTRSEPFA